MSDAVQTKLEALHVLARAVAGAEFRAGALLQRVCGAVVDALAFERAAIFRYVAETDTAMPVAAHGAEEADEAKVPAAVPLARLPIFRDACDSGRATFSHDVAEEQALSDVAVELLGLRSLVVVPLISEGRCLGFLCADRGGRQFTLDDDELELLTTIGTFTAVFLEKAIEQSKLRRLNELKSQFIALASHELRTPAATIYGISATIAHRWDKLSSEHRTELRHVLYQQAERLRRLVNELLDLSRVEAGAATLVPEQCSVRQHLEEIVALVAAERRGEISLDVPDDLQAVLDRDVFDRIMSNLLSNALRYGKPPVSLRARRRGSELDVLVEDRGPGIPGRVRTEPVRAIRACDDDAVGGRSRSRIGDRAIVCTHSRRPDHVRAGRAERRLLPPPPSCRVVGNPRRRSSAACEPGDDQRISSRSGPDVPSCAAPAIGYFHTVNERELERKARVAGLLLEAARELGETLEPERVYDRFHELLADVVEHDGLVVSSCEARDELIRCEYAWSDGERLDPSIFPTLPLNRQGGGMQSRVIITGEALLFNDVSDRVRDPSGTYYDVDPEGTLRKLPHSGPPGTRAAMMVPVKHEGSVVGVVQVMSNAADYSAEELELVEGLVGQMAAAVRNARLQRERSRLEAAEAAARAVAAEREQAASVLEAVGDGIFLVDGGGVVRLWNRAAALVTGIPPDRACGSAIAAVFPDWDALAARIPVADDGSAAQAATVPVDVNGREVWLSFVAVRSADGIVYAFRDLTAERRLEEEKSDFIATISHELRTPMAAIHGAAQTLLRQDVELPPEQKRQLIEMIATQAARLAHITEEVLLATQLDRGGLRVEQQAVDLGELARATVDALRPQLPDAAVIHVEVAPETGAATGAPDRIQQVLVNLLDNATKYAAGPVTVRVEASNGFMRLSVADSGPGLTPTEQERVFEKFYRAGPQLTRASGGTGLGLYISRELVQRMGGRLNVRSQPGRGTTFVVELPRAVAPTAP